MTRDSSWRSEPAERQALRDALRVDRLGDSRDARRTFGDAVTAPSPPPPLAGQATSGWPPPGDDALRATVTKALASIERSMGEQAQLVPLIRELVAACRDLALRHEELAGAVARLTETTATEHSGLGPGAAAQSRQS